MGELLISGLLDVSLLVTCIRGVRGHPEQFMWAAVMTLTRDPSHRTTHGTPHYVVFIIPLMFTSRCLSSEIARRGNLVGFVLGWWCCWLCGGCISC